MQDCLTGPNYLTRYCLAISLGNLETQECFLFILYYVSFAGTGNSYFDMLDLLGTTKVKEHSFQLLGSAFQFLKRKVETFKGSIN